MPGIVSDQHLKNAGWWRWQPRGHRPGSPATQTQQRSVGRGSTEGRRREHKTKALFLGEADAWAKPCGGATLITGGLRTPHLPGKAPESYETRLSWPVPSNAPSWSHIPSTVTPRVRIMAPKATSNDSPAWTCLPNSIHTCQHLVARPLGELKRHRELALASPSCSCGRPPASFWVYLTSSLRKCHWVYLKNCIQNLATYDYRCCPQWGQVPSPAGAIEQVFFLLSSLLPVSL